jgi:hypothetical protein
MTARNACLRAPVVSRRQHRRSFYIVRRRSNELENRAVGSRRPSERQVWRRVGLAASAHVRVASPWLSLEDVEPHKQAVRDLG